MHTPKVLADSIKYKISSNEILLKNVRVLEFKCICRQEGLDDAEMNLLNKTILCINMHIYCAYIRIYNRILICLDFKYYSTYVPETIWYRWPSGQSCVPWNPLVVSSTFNVARLWPNIIVSAVPMLIRFVLDVKPQAGDYSIEKWGSFSDQNLNLNVFM